MNFPVRIKSVAWKGGACPYQIEATTEEGKYFYLRYRGGYLRFGVWNRGSDFDHENYLYSEKVSDEFDGSVDADLFKQKLEGKVIFPEGFEF